MLPHGRASRRLTNAAAFLVLALTSLSVSDTKGSHSLNGQTTLKDAHRAELPSHPTYFLPAQDATAGVFAAADRDGVGADSVMGAHAARKPALATSGRETAYAELAVKEYAAELLATELLDVVAQRFRAGASAAAAGIGGETEGVYNHGRSKSQGGFLTSDDEVFQFLWKELNMKSARTDDNHVASEGVSLSGKKRRLRGGNGGSHAHDAGSSATIDSGVFDWGLYNDIPEVVPVMHVPDDCPKEAVDFLKIDSTWVNIALTFVCVVCAGLAAGLTMGLVSIEPLEMAIKQRSGTADERKQAARILPLVSRHHFLLVTLLLFNSLANEALPIFLGNLVPSWVAVILSVSLVLFFGEILPSAVFTGRGQLAIASGMAWFVYFLMLVLSPIAWPLSWMLDRVLGIEGFKRYNRAEISALVEVQQELANDGMHDLANTPLHPDEVAIVNGVLSTAEKCVAEAMITMDKVFCLSQDEKLSGSTMADIMASGYSRVLVYDGSDTRNIRGYLQIKKLIVLNPDDERDIRSLMLRIPVVVSPNKSLLELLNTFQTGHSHLALVSNSPGVTLESMKRGVPLEGAARPLGIITLEDIIEEILQEEIMDESDRMAEFIEKRARETLLRFTRMRRQRKVIGKYEALGRTVPPQESGLTPPLLERSYSTTSTRSGASAINSSPRAFEFIENLPAPPGINERSRLLANLPGRRRNRSPLDCKGGSSRRGSAVGDIVRETGATAARPGDRRGDAELSEGVLGRLRTWRNHADDASKPGD